MAAYVEKARAPFAAKLSEKLALTEELLYRRGNFNGSWDGLILQALLEQKDAEIAFSPGFPLGHDAAPRRRHHARARDGPDRNHVSFSTLSRLTGAQIKTILEVADNLFHPDPYLQQGGAWCA